MRNMNPTKLSLYRKAAHNFFCGNSSSICCCSSSICVLQQVKIEWGVEAQLHSSLLVLDTGEWSTAHASHFAYGEGNPRSHWKIGWVGVTVGLNVSEKINTSCSCRLRYAGSNFSDLRLISNCHIQKLSQGTNIRHKLNSNTDETLFNMVLNITAVISVHFCY